MILKRHGLEMLPLKHSWYPGLASSPTRRGCSGLNHDHESGVTWGGRRAGLACEHLHPPHRRLGQAVGGCREALVLQTSVGSQTVSFIFVCPFKWKDSDVPGTEGSPCWHQERLRLTGGESSPPVAVVSTLLDQGEG